MSLSSFTNLYPLSKTLRFELKPQGKTLENIQKNGLLDEDQHRAESYVKVKKIIDKYHKKFIEESLKNFDFKNRDKNKNDLLSEYFSYYQLDKLDEKQKKTFQEIQKNLRKQIADHLTKDDAFKRIDKKELIKEDLLNFVSTNEEKKLVNEFADFTTYFTGFHENRQNMYSADEKSTAIAYRLIHENLPKFVDNINVFAKVEATDIKNNFEKLYNDMSEYLNVSSIAEMFNLNYYSEVLTQTQIDAYNAIIGGKTLKNGDKIQGLNEYINLYNQKQKDKNLRLPKLKQLFKQILSDRKAISWWPEEFKTDNEVLESIEKCYCNLNEQVFNKEKDGEYSLKEILVNLKDFDLSKIYIRNDVQLTDISQKMFGSWAIIIKCIEDDFTHNNPQKTKESGEKYDERKNKYVKSFDRFSIADLNNYLKNAGIGKTIEAYFAELGAVNTETEQKENLFAIIENAYSEVKELLNTSYPENKNLSQDKDNIGKIKVLLDAIKDLQHFVKPLFGKGNESGTFYSEFIPLWKILDSITPLYNKVRNYATRKPYSEEKIKLNFENKGNLLGGWVDSKTNESDNGTQYGGYLFREKNGINEYDYYLGISSDCKLFRKDTIVVEEDKSSFERLDYYQLKSQSIYGNSYIGDYLQDKQEMISVIDNFIVNSSNEDLKTEIENERTKKQPKINTPIGYLHFIHEKNKDIYDALIVNDNFERKNKELIENLTKTLLSLNRIQNAQKLAMKKYNLFTEIMDDIDELCKEKVFEYFPISQNELDDAINRSKKTLYLFKISNKDLNYADTFIAGKRESRGTDNLHTLYFKALMAGKQNVLDIGVGQVFYRKETKGLKKEPTHLANCPIDNKNPENRKKQSIFSYDIIKDRRYTINKFQFHLSIIQNYKTPKKIDINQNVNEYLKESNGTHIIGIDRGERHLLYLTVIDSNGNIKEQFSLNEIVNEYKGNTYRTNYHDLLDKKETDRNEARKSWRTIENIKDLKEGYLSQVIHKITDLMIKYNAIVVLEDLNFGFMRGRQKVEKQVYQKFEKMLIDKLNYLADKNKNPEEVGGILNAYQLTSKFDSFQKLGKQSGFLFYIPAWNTSKMDPTTGFVNLFDTRYENAEKAKAFFCKFDSIRYNANRNWFELAFDYNRFTNKAEGTKTQWTLCSYGHRIETFRNPEKNSNWDNKDIDLTEAFKNHFNTFKIDINGNLKDAIANQTEKAFFEGLLYLLKLTLQMRNSITGTETDYLISPVMNDKGEFYDSRTCSDNLPKNADANGAYNIARKGLILIKRLQQQGIEEFEKSKKAEKGKPSKWLPNKEWLQFAQNINK